jgi:hypothetical protein
MLATDFFHLTELASVGRNELSATTVVALVFPEIVGRSPVPILNTLAQSFADSSRNSRNQLGRTPV